MKYGLRSVLLLVLVFAVTFAVIQRKREREARIASAVTKMRVAVESYRNPVSTTIAMYSLRDLGISDAEIALRRFVAQEKVGNSGFVSDKLPFLFKPLGRPATKTSLFYCKGLIFDTFPDGLQGGGKLSEFDFTSLKFEERDFVPTDDLLGACKIAIDHFRNTKNPDEWAEIKIETYIYSQAHHAVEHLYSTDPNICDIEKLMKFLTETKLRWNSESNEYELQ